MLESLPDRPLTFGEADSLVDGSNQLAPLTILPEPPTDELRPGVYTLQVHDHPEEPSAVYLLGFDPEAEAWVRVHTFGAWSGAPPRLRSDPARACTGREILAFAPILPSLPSSPSRQ